MSPRLVCFYCGRGCELGTAKYHVAHANNLYTRDHVFPKHERAEMKKALGWRRSEVYYTLPACVSCNQNRGSTNFLVFMGAKITLDKEPKLVYTF